MSWPTNNSGGLGSAFSKQSEYNSSRDNSKPGPESPSNFTPRAANYPAAHGQPIKGLSNESNGKQGPIDMGGASHSGAYGMMRLRNRVMQMAENNSRIASGRAMSGAINL